jgi:dipicolinate synthase subunit A
MEELSTTIYGSNVLLTGFGRITKVMVKALIGLGANVSVTARKYSDLAWAKIYGCEAIHISELDSHLPKFDILFNTVPAVILDEKKLSSLKENCLVIDLASKPGGVDFDTARALGIKTIWALSLPGKVAPITSGEIIAETIRNILSERGEI